MSSSLALCRSGRALAQLQGASYVAYKAFNTSSAHPEPSAPDTPPVIDHHRAYATSTTITQPPTSAMPASWSSTVRGIWDALGMAWEGSGREARAARAAPTAAPAAFKAAAQALPTVTEDMLQSVAGDLPKLHALITQHGGDDNQQALPVQRIAEILIEHIDGSSTTKSTPRPLDEPSVAAILQYLHTHPTLAAAIPRRVVRNLVASLKTRTMRTPPIPALASSILCILASLKHGGDEEFLEMLCHATCAGLTNLPPATLVAVLSAVASLGHHDLRLVDGIVGTLLWHVPSLPTASLSKIVSSLASLGHTDAMTDVLLDAVAEAAIKRMSRFQPNDLARMVLGFAELEHSRGPLDARLHESMLKTMLAQHKVLQPQAVVDVVVACAKIDSDSPNAVSLMGVLCEDIKTNIEQYSAPQLVDLLWGLSKLRYADGHLYLLACREILLDLHALQARHLADLLFSFAAVNCRPGERLLDAIQARAIASLHGMTARELCNTLWALSIMDRMSPCIWRRVTQWLENKTLEQLRPQHLTRAYQAQLLAHTHEHASEMLLPQWLQAPARRGWCDWVYFQHQRLGPIHSEVVSSIINLKMPYEIGSMLEDGTYWLDIAVDVPVDGVVHKVGIKVDQGHSFTCNKPFSPLADTIFSRKFLHSRSLPVVHIERHRWQEHTTSEARTAYLKRLLEATARLIRV